MSIENSLNKYKALHKKEFNPNAGKYKIACAVGVAVLATAVVGVAFTPLGTSLLFFTITAENSVAAMTSLVLAAGTAFKYYLGYKQEEEEEKENEKKIDKKWGEIKGQLRKCQKFSDIGISRYEYFNLLEKYDPNQKISNYFEKNLKMKPNDFERFSLKSYEYSKIKVEKKSFNKKANLGFLAIGLIMLVVGSLALFPSGAGIAAFAAVGIGEAITLIASGSAPILHYVSKNIYNFYDQKKTAKTNVELKKEYAEDLITELKEMEYEKQNMKFIDNNRLEEEFRHIFKKAIESKDEKLFKYLARNKNIANEYCAEYRNEHSEFIDRCKDNIARKPDIQKSDEDRAIEELHRQLYENSRAVRERLCKNGWGRNGEI